MAAPRPEPNPPEERDGIIQFRSEEEFRAWAYENVADPEEFVQGAIAGLVEFQEWIESGKPGLPPGSILLRDYLREHPI